MRYLPSSLPPSRPVLLNYDLSIPIWYLDRTKGKGEGEGREEEEEGLDKETEQGGH